MLQDNQQAGVLARLIEVFDELVRSTEAVVAEGRIDESEWIVRAVREGRKNLDVILLLAAEPAGIPPVGLGMDFGQALQALRRGVRVCRAGWNGKGMWLLLVGSGDAAEYEVFIRMRDGWKDLSPELGLQLLPWIGMRTADGGFVPWLASQTDVLAKDWQVVEG